MALSILSIEMWVYMRCLRIDKCWDEVSNVQWKDSATKLFTCGSSSFRLQYAHLSYRIVRDKVFRD